MKTLIATVLSVFALSAFAQTKGEPVAAKTTPNPVVAPAADAKKEAKPAKSTPAKDEKAAVPATKPASK